MIPEKIINTLLTGSADILAIVKPSVGGEVRIYPGLAPEQKPVPLLVYRRIDANVLNRPINPRPGAVQICRARMRVAVVTSSDAGGYTTAQSLMQHVRSACGNKLGTIAGYPQTHVGPPMVADELPDPVTGLALDAVDFMVTYRETT